MENSSLIPPLSPNTTGPTIEPPSQEHSLIERFSRLFFCCHPRNDTVFPFEQPHLSAIEQLPQHVLYQVFEQCQERDFPSIALTCTTFHNIVQSKPFRTLRADRDPIYAAFNVEPYSAEGKKQICDLVDKIFNFFPMHTVCKTIKQDRRTRGLPPTTHPKHILWYASEMSLAASLTGLIKKASLSLVEYSKTLRVYLQEQNLSLIVATESPVFCLPPEIIALPHLEHLELSKTLISRLPNAIGSMHLLQTLNLDYNQIEELPPSIRHLKQLRALSICHNQLKTLPETISGLSALEQLFLRNNYLEKLPDSIGELHRLKELDIRYNNLTSLPESFARLNHLCSMQLFGNNISSLPFSPEISTTLDIPSIERDIEPLYTRLARGELDPILEVAGQKIASFLAHKVNNDFQKAWLWQ